MVRVRGALARQAELTQNPLRSQHRQKIATNLLAKTFIGRRENASVDKQGLESFEISRLTVVMRTGERAFGLTKALKHLVQMSPRDERRAS